MNKSLRHTHLHIELLIDNKLVGRFIRPLNKGGVPIKDDIATIHAAISWLQPGFS
jgi:hypothetical protein